MKHYEEAVERERLVRQAQCDAVNGALSSRAQRRRQEREAQRAAKTYGATAFGGPRRQRRHPAMPAPEADMRKHPLLRMFKQRDAKRVEKLTAEEAAALYAALPDRR